MELLFALLWFITLFVWLFTLLWGIGARNEAREEEDAVRRDYQQLHSDYLAVKDQLEEAQSQAAEDERACTCCTCSCSTHGGSALTCPLHRTALNAQKG